MVAQFSNKPGMVHWEAVKHIYRYLAGTKGLVLTFRAGKKGLKGYMDTDSASQEHRHPISGYAYILDGGAVSWMLKKQELVTLLMAKAEYVAAMHTVKEGVWLCCFVEEVFQLLVNPTILYCNNQVAITLHQQTDPCSVQAVQKITADYSKVPSITDLYRKQTKKPAYKPYLKISPDLLCTKNKPFTYCV